VLVGEVLLYLAGDRPPGVVVDGAGDAHPVVQGAALDQHDESLVGPGLQWRVDVDVDVAERQGHGCSSRSTTASAKVVHAETTKAHSCQRGASPL